MSMDGTGVINWINTHKGYGQIKTNEGSVFYFPIETLEGISFEPKKGVIVNFQLGEYLIFGSPAIVSMKLHKKQAKDKRRKAPEAAL